MSDKDINAYIEKNRQRFLDELIQLLRIQSISALEEHEDDVYKAAEYTRDRLLEAGLDKADLHETKGHPIVYGEKIVDPALPTVLIYGHYDVQPADPLELWKSPPFEPEIRDDKIYGRGTADDKGQFYMHVKAFEIMDRTGNLPCNVKFMIEGEEEVGSASLETFVKENEEMLSCDVILISDTSMISNDHPSISTGLKGLSYLEVKVIGPNRDLHSGTYGGAVANPANVLAKMIASLIDDNNRVTIPGFYDKVVELSNEERQRLAEAPFDEAAFKKELDVEALGGEKGYTAQEQLGIRPTLDVNGIWGGYTGRGAKTVLPSEASAKVSMRLVPDQDHHEITRLFINHIKAIAPRSVKVEVTPHHGGQPAVTPIDSVAFKAAEKAFEEGWGKKPFPTRDGGSIPIVALFEKVLKSHTILMGLGLDSDAIHSPNESFGLFNFFKGIETSVLFHKHFAALQGSR